MFKGSGSYGHHYQNSPLPRDLPSHKNNLGEDDSDENEEYRNGQGKIHFHSNVKIRFGVMVICIKVI